MLNSVRPGDVLAGKYRVERVLGAGGMGMVVAARHLELQTLVALKFMLSSAAANPEAARRFVQEARSAARLRSEHVARVSDYGTLESGEPYIVIEYLEGEDLAALLTRSGPLPVELAVDLMLQACEAMDEAHSNGIIHRDIKPQNLFLTKRHKGTPCVKVLDFGLSKVALTGDSPAGLQHTNTAALLGSPLYMSPEQMRSARNVDHRADIWSLGATFYELLCQQVPFPADSMMELCLKLNQEHPRSLRVTRPDIPIELERAVLRCLEKDPAARFSSVAELAEAIAPFARAHVAPALTEATLPRHGTVAAVSNDGAATDGNALSGSDGSRGDGKKADANWAATQDPSRFQSRSRLIWAALGALAVASALGAVWLRSNRRSEAAAETSDISKTALAGAASALPPPPVPPPPGLLATSPAAPVAAADALAKAVPTLSALRVAAPVSTATAELRRSEKGSFAAARVVPKAAPATHAASAAPISPPAAGATEDPWSRK